MSVIDERSFDHERIIKLEKKVRSLERMVERRNNKIIELEKEVKRLKKLENLKNKPFETEELFMGDERISVSETIESIKEKVNNDELKVILFLISLNNVYENDPALVQECKKMGRKILCTTKRKVGGREMSDWKEALFESKKNDITSFTYEIITKAREEYDKFIFETLRPYCEEAVKMEISKNDLEEALTMWKNRNEERKVGKWKKILIATVPFTIYGYECPFCEFRTATDSFNYCPHCGERLEVEE